MAKKKAKKSLDELLEEALVKKDKQPYEVPGNWVFTKLGSICTKPQYGWTTKAKQEGDVYLVRTTDITSGNLDWQNVPYCSEVPKDLSKYLLKEDDIVISRAGSIGVSYLIEKPKKAVFASYLIRFNPIINKKYLYLFLKSPIYWSSISEKSSGIALPNINATKLGEIRFPLPPLPEQKRIVKKLSSMLGRLKEARELIQEAKNSFEERRSAILNKAFTGEVTKKWREENPDVASAEKLIEMLIAEKKKQRKEGKKEKIPTYEEMIIEESEQPYEVPGNWVWVKLEELFDITSSKRVFKAEWKSSGIPFYRAREIAELSFKDKINNDLFISKEMYEDYSKKYGVPNAGDILITAVGTLGKVYIVKTNDKFYFKDGNVIWLKKKNILFESSIIKYFFESFFMLKKIQDISTGTVVKTYTIIKAKETLFPLPPLSEQKEIVRILDKLLDHEDEARALIDMEEQIDLLEKSILSKAFSGELGTNDTNDEPAIELLRRSLKEKMNK